MKPLDIPLLADENIHPTVIQTLLLDGKNIRSVRDEGLVGHDDIDILRRAHSQGRAILTHDSDFGTLAIRAGEPFTGIVYLRPGHILPAFVCTMLKALESVVADIATPFIVVVERKESTIKVRMRSNVTG
jgi:predicted nuclease of predicted toxin-antitoxin system